jgi:hypothetical protein
MSLDQWVPALSRPSSICVAHREQILFESHLISFTRLKCLTASAVDQLNVLRSETTVAQLTMHPNNENLQERTPPSEQRPVTSFVKKLTPSTLTGPSPLADNFQSYPSCLYRYNSRHNSPTPVQPASLLTSQTPAEPLVTSGRFIPSNAHHQHARFNKFTRLRPTLKTLERHAANTLVLMLYNAHGGSRSNEKTGKQPPHESNDNLQPAYRISTP